MVGIEGRICDCDCVTPCVCAENGSPNVSKDGAAGTEVPNASKESLEAPPPKASKLPLENISCLTVLLAVAVAVAVVVEIVVDCANGSNVAAELVVPKASNPLLTLLLPPPLPNASNVEELLPLLPNCVDGDYIYVCCSFSFS